MIRRTEATIHPRTSCSCGVTFDRYRLALGQKRLLAGDEHVRETPDPRLPHAGAIRQGLSCRKGRACGGRRGPSAHVSATKCFPTGPSALTYLPAGVWVLVSSARIGI